MDMATIVPPTAHIAAVDSLPAEGEDAPDMEAFSLAARTSEARVDIQTWHHWLGHLHADAILCMSHHGLVRGLHLAGHYAHSPVQTLPQGQANAC